jgi:hypothetical protein
MFPATKNLPISRRLEKLLAKAARAQGRACGFATKRGFNLFAACLI